MRWLISLLALAVILLLYLIHRVDRIESAVKPRLHLIATS